MASSGDLGSRPRLEKPAVRWEAPFHRFAEDFRQAGESGAYEWYRRGVEDFPDYCDELLANAVGARLPPGWVPISTFWMIDGEEIVAAIRIRHSLNAFVEEHAGHIGYDVAPSHRRRGLGQRLLELGLVEASRLGLERALLIADIDNTASIRIIERCGGVLWDERSVAGERVPLRRYWIHVSRPEAVRGHRGGT